MEIQECIGNGSHLMEVDNDGYCTVCGHQEDIACPQCGEPHSL